jgi:hypothetical protein
MDCLTSSVQQTSTEWKKLFKMSEGRRKKEERKASFCVKNFRKMREKVKEKFEEFC